MSITSKSMISQWCFNKRRRPGWLWPDTTLTKLGIDSVVPTLFGVNEKIWGVAQRGLYVFLCFPKAAAKLDRVSLICHENDNIVTFAFAFIPQCFANCYICPSWWTLAFFSLSSFFSLQVCNYDLQGCTYSGPLVELCHNGPKITP